MRNLSSVTDYSSIYTIKDFYQQKILPLYFDKDKLELSSVGSLGMFLDITGSTTEDMINIMGRYINEIMPGQSELPDFIYANAANFGISNILATPAKMSMLLLVKEKDVINYSTPVEDHTEFVLDSDMSILVDGLYYSLPYNVKIRSNLYKGEYNHMSFYDITYNNDVANEPIPFIKTMKTMINGDVWLVLRVNVYQYERKKYPEPINTNSKLNIPYIDLNYENQLCNFEAFYTPVGSTTPIQLVKKMDTATPTTTPFIYYKLTGDKSIRFSFANDDRYFVPDYNSSVTIYLYETNGDDGVVPLQKDGLTVSIRANTEDESLAYNRSIFPQGLSQGNSVNGKDQLSLENIKRLTSEKQTTVNSYTTDADLNTYFTNFASIYNHDAIFVKQRDDYAGREYGCFTKMGDGTDIFPTNTLNLRLTTDDIDVHYEALRQYIIKPGTVFHYENDETTEVVVKKQEGEDAQDIEYANMALITITTKPNKVNYYMNTIDQNVEMDYSYFNLNSIFNFVVQECNVSRDAIHGEDEYTIELTLARVDGVFNDIQSQEFLLQSSNGEIVMDKLEVLIIFNTSVGNYVRMKCTTDTTGEDGEYLYTFTAKIGTTDMIDEERILLTDLLKRKDNATDERLINMMNPDLKFVVFYKYDEDNGNHDYVDIDLVTNHTVCNIFTPQENEFYFAYPLNLIRSHVLFEDRPDTEDGFGFFLKQVPLFGKKFLLEETTDIDQILTDLSSEHTFLSNIVDLLHGAFAINMKFYCTYGRSRSFYIGYGTSREIINHVNCKIAIGIRFYEGIIQEDYLDDIRAYIKSFFESINKLATGTNQVFISVLDQKLHNKYADQVKYTIFYSINDYDSKYQVIEMENQMNESPLPDFVPEYLTLKTNDVILTTI